MPYTPAEQREPLREPLTELQRALAEQGYRADDACQVVAEIAGGYLTHHGLRWVNFESAKCILTAALREVQRLEDHYEDIKRHDNGDLTAFASIREILWSLEVEHG